MKGWLFFSVLFFGLLTLGTVLVLPPYYNTCQEVRR